MENFTRCPPNSLHNHFTIRRQNFGLNLGPTCPLLFFKEADLGVSALGGRSCNCHFLCGETAVEALNYVAFKFIFLLLIFIFVNLLSFFYQLDSESAPCVNLRPALNSAILSPPLYGATAVFSEEPPSWTY